MSVRRWCVFCGSSPGRDPRFLEAAIELGTALAANGIEVVYGGGRIGLMGAVADAAVAAGGRVIGIIPESLERKEVAHRGLAELYIVDSMHDRKAKMAELSDGFLALPGGFGTFEEYCEAVTWVQLGIQSKPTWLVNIAGYYDPLVEQFDRAVAEGFVSPANRTIVEVFPTVASVIERLTG